MELDKYIESALRSVLKNPIVSLLRQIGIASILKQSNFTKRSVGVSPYLVLLILSICSCCINASPPLSNKAPMRSAKMSITAS